jgi:uncharacterized protein with HEPN domain
MKAARRGDLLRLKDILCAIAALERHRVEDRAVFDADELLRHFAWKQIEIIGEAASKLSAELRDAHPEVPWVQIVGMRNRLVHDYAEVDWGIIWLVYAAETVQLRPQIEAILKERETHG